MTAGPYQRLAVAVLQQAVRDARGGSATAAAWLDGPSESRSFWCQLAGISARHVEQWRTVPARTVATEEDAA
jgi:hypothetical protein